MNKEKYFIITSIIFGAVALLHLFRLINNWTFQVGPLTVPMWTSFLGIIFPGILCVWAISLLKK